MEIPFDSEDFVSPQDIAKRANEVEQAIRRGETLQDVFEISDKLMDQKFIAAYQFMVEKDDKSAHELASYLAAMNPYDERNWLIRAFCKLIEGNADMAILSLAFMKILNPSDPLPYTLAAYCYMQNEDFEGAQKLLKIAEDFNGDQNLKGIFSEMDALLEFHLKGDVEKEESIKEHLLAHFNHLIDKVFKKEGRFQTKARSNEQRKEENQNLHLKLNKFSLAALPVGLPEEYEQFFTHFQGVGKSKFVEYSLTALGYMGQNQKKNEEK